MVRMPAGIVRGADVRRSGIGADSCGSASCRVGGGRVKRRFVAGVCSLVIVGLALGACSRGSHQREGRADRTLGTAQPSVLPQFQNAIPQVDPRLGTTPSPRIVDNAAPIPKGGGHHKIGAPYRVAGRLYIPQHDPSYDRRGIASWYGRAFHGRKTANGEIFDKHALTAAHPTLPMPSFAYVTNLANNRTVLVRINDRGPFAHDRIIDLSRRVAQLLGSESSGLAEVRVRYAGPAPLDGNDTHEWQFLYAQPWSRSVLAELRQRDRFALRRPMALGAVPQSEGNPGTGQ